MKGPPENRTHAESPIEERNLTRIGESVRERRAGSGRPHKGLDLFAPEGSPVLSATGGKVLRVVDGSTSVRTSGQRAGWFVDILGSDGLIYRYLHLGDQPTVRANQLLRAGSKLGTVGTGGIQHARPHVHFEIRRGDYSEQQQDYGEPVDPLAVLPLGNFTNGGLRMADTDPHARGTGTSAWYQPAPIDRNAPDAQAAMAFLVSKGWTADEVERLLNQHVDAETTDRHVEEHLLSLGWTASDIARLLVGPEKSHLTAETLFRQHAVNSEADQKALLQALAQAGAQNVKLDPSLLSGLNAAHLHPEKPSDLDQLISQFAALPKVQKRRFLLLLDAQTPSKKAPAPPPDVPHAPPKKARGTMDGGHARSSGPAGDVLPVVKSSLDLLSTALKGLLGATQGGTKKGANGSGEENPAKNRTEDEPDAEDPSPPAEDDPAEGDGGDRIDDVPSTNEETNPFSEPEDRMGSGSESEPD